MSINKNTCQIDGLLLISIDGSKLVVEVSSVGVFFFQFDGQQPRTWNLLYDFFQFGGSTVILKNRPVLNANAKWNDGREFCPRLVSISTIRSIVYPNKYSLSYRYWYCTSDRRSNNNNSSINTNNTFRGSNLSKNIYRYIRLPRTRTLPPVLLVP